MDPEEAKEEASDDDFDFDAIATRAVVAVGLKPQAALTGHLKKAKELGLHVDVSNEQLYLTGASRKGKKAFDTGVGSEARLDYGDFAEGLAPQAPKDAAVYEREVRAAPVRPVDDSKIRKQERKNMHEQQLDKWFGMRKQTLTPELEKELKVIKLRANIDPKRFYKGQDSKELPKFFAVATEVSSGMQAAGLQATNTSKRGTSFLNEVLRDQTAQEWTWKKAGEVQTRSSGFSGHGKRGISGKKRGGAWKNTKHK